MVTTGRLHAEAGEMKSMKNSMVRYFLNASVKKTAIKSGDIVKQCLRGEHKWFPILLPEIEDILSELYGLQINEIKEKTGKFYLVTSEITPASEIGLTAVQRQENRLLLLVLTYIFMKGGQVQETSLFGFLRKLNIEDEPHDYVGEFRKSITETFIKKMYLRKEKIEMESGNIEERFQYSWGQRAELEFKKIDCLNFAATVLKRKPESFLSQFEECASDSEDIEMAD